MLNIWPKKGRITIMQNRNGTFFVLKTAKTRLTNTIYTWHDNTYHLNWVRTAYITSKNMPALYFVEGTADPVNFKPVNSTDAKTLKMLVKDNVIGQLVKASLTQNYGNIIMIAFILLGIGVGFGVGFIFRPFISPTPPQIINGTSTSPPVGHVP